MGAILVLGLAACGGYGGQWVPMDASNTEDYNGGVFNFNIDDEISGVAELHPDAPYSAYCGEICFSFDGEDTINVTNGGDYSETYFRSQY